MTATTTTTETAASVAATQSVQRARIGSAFVRVLTLTLLLSAAPVYESFSLSGLSNGDIWWHLRTGLWMLQNHTVPRHGLFTQHDDLPWIASSWGYEIVAAVAYKLLGVRCIPALVMAGKAALALVTFTLARGWRGNFWGAVLLSAAAQYATVDLQHPYIISILFFAIELALLLYSRRCGDARPLFLLPLLFVLWANLHMQYVLGLVLLAMFLLAEGAQALLVDQSAALRKTPVVPLGKVAIVAMLSVMATLLTPYGIYLLPDSLSSAYGKVLFEWFAGMKPMSFRRPENFVLLLTVMIAFFVLGRQRSRDLFKLASMVFFLVLAFRVQRDAWCALLVAVAVMADFFCSAAGAEAGVSSRIPKWAGAVLAGLVITLMAVSAARIPGEQQLEIKAAHSLPVRAADFIRANRLPAPLFNDRDWGGFLIWYLPQYPVAIDDRVNLYGRDINERYFRITSGTQRFQTDPNFAAARTILLQRRSDMALAFTTLPVLQGKFRVAYQDDMAVILLPQ